MCETITHPGYDENTRKNDIAILRLCKYVNFNEKTKLSPACLPSSEDNNYENIMVRIAALSCAHDHWQGLLLRPVCPHGQVSHQGAKRRWKWTQWPMIRWGQRKSSWFLILDLILINRWQIYISVHQHRYNKYWRYHSWHALCWRLQFTTFTNPF